MMEPAKNNNGSSSSFSTFRKTRNTGSSRTASSPRSSSSRSPTALRQTHQIRRRASPPTPASRRKRWRTPNVSVLAGATVKLVATHRQGQGRADRPARRREDRDGEGRRDRFRRLDDRQQGQHLSHRGHERRRRHVYITRVERIRHHPARRPPAHGHL